MWYDWTSIKLPLAKTVADPGYNAWIIKVELGEWLTRNVGPRASYKDQYASGNWHHDVPMACSYMTFYFRNPDQAMLFKLTWA